MKAASKLHSPYPETELDIIDAELAGDILWIFDGEYAPLDNFYQTPVLWEGLTFPTVEHAYQFAKVAKAWPLAKRHQDAIRTAPTPGVAKALGQRVPLRADWETYKFQAMRLILQDKFDRDIFCRELLISTEDRMIVEGNTWGDDCWGMIQVRPGILKGCNALGNMLMELRASYRRR